MTNERREICVARMIKHHMNEADECARYAHALFHNYLQKMYDRTERNKLFVAWQDFRRMMWEHINAAQYWQNKYSC